MGGMAASGAYYMSMGAQYIMAQPTTLTGSIGIFGALPDFSDLMTKKLHSGYHHTWLAPCRRLSPAHNP